MLFLVRILPRVACSRAFGKLASISHPRWFARLSIAVFHRAFPKIDLSEALDPSRSSYASLQAFFTRRLKPGMRPVEPGLLSAPSDGVFGQSGPIQSDTVLQAKGVPYSVAQFLQDPALAAELEGGAFSTIYLAPWNYHRVHHGFSGVLEACRHIPGDLWPVHRAAVEGIPGLFVANERAWVAVRSEDGLAVAVMVGAYNVGSIRLTANPELGRSVQGAWKPDSTASVQAGDELGIFEMGSTVVLLVSKSLREKSGGVAFPETGRSVRCGMGMAFPK